MHKKKYLFLLAVIPTAIVIACVVMASMPSPGVTKENFDRVRIAMSEAEVEGLFGDPVLTIVDGSGKMLQFKAEGTVRIIFDKNGRVREKIWTGPVPLTFTERVKRFLILPPAD